MASVGTTEADVVALKTAVRLTARTASPALLLEVVAKTVIKIEAPMMTMNAVTRHATNAADESSNSEGHSSKL